MIKIGCLNFGSLKTKIVRKKKCTYDIVYNECWFTVPADQIFITPLLIYFAFLYEMYLFIVSPLCTGIVHPNQKVNIPLG